MKEAGGLLIALGVLAIFGAFFVTTSTHVGYVPSSAYLPRMPSDVVNLQGLHIQALAFQGGFAAIIAGAILFGFGTVDETLKRNAGAKSQDAAPEIAAPQVAPDAGTPVTPVENAELAPDDVGEKKLESAVVAGGVALLLIVIIAVMIARSSHPPAALPTSNDANMLMDANYSASDLEMNMNIEPGSPLADSINAQRAADEATNAADAAVRDATRGAR